MKKIHLIDVTLAFLIILSLVLTGSLWFDNYHGLSLAISELPFWLNETFDFGETEYTELIKPYKVTLTNGDNGNYIYYAFSEGNVEGFNTVFSIINNLTNLAIDEAFPSEWNELLTRKSIICEFGGAIDANLLTSVMSNSTIPTDIVQNISAIAVTKALNGVTIYLKCDESKIYRMSFEGDITPFTNYLNDYSKKTIYAKYVKLSEMGTTTFYGNKKVSENSYVLFPMSAKQSNRRYVSEIVSKKFFDNYDMDTLEKLVSSFFSTNEYTKFTTTDNSYIFIKDDGSTVKVLNSGIFEYNTKLVYDDTIDSTIMSSFNVALDYINKFGETSVYLLSGQKVDNAYEYKFGINKDDIPVVNNSQPIDEDRRIYIHIKVLNDKVIYCKQSLNRYETVKTLSYISSFGTNILDNILANIEKDSVVTVENLDLVYDVSSNNKYPFWYAKYKVLDDENYIFTSAAKKKIY